ncbi:YadA-like family protein [Paraburkholderia sp. J67]|uniref:YadA-like family protein n=1 Tax=Paraburkholderia sp. J67 TaxID=2805435 RepID=UPI002ABE1B4E|nr:YadA-like family protein [Paraburkholderia sp. J67]
MNKTYRSVWNEATGTWVAVQENAKGRAKSSSKKAGAVVSATMTAAVAVAALGASMEAHAQLAAGGGKLGPLNGGDGVSIGFQTYAVNGYVLGSYSTTVGSYSIGVGVGVNVNGANDIGIGSKTYATGVDAMAIGNTASAYGANGSTALGGHSLSSNSYATALGDYASATGAGATAIGSSAVARDWGGVALGMGAVSTVTGDTSAANGDAVAIGYQATASEHAAIATGPHAYATAVRSIAIGDYALASNTNAVALGMTASATGGNALALGAGAIAKTDNSVALGNGSVTGLATPAAGDTIGGNTYSYAGAQPVGVVSVGAAGSERQITNVAAGRVTASSTDGLNGSQLYATNQALSGLSVNVADAVKYDSSTHDSVTLGGTGASEPVALHNVAAGTLGASSTDAVNGAQLYSVVNGDGIKYLHVNSTLPDSAATGADSTAIGPQAVASGTNAIGMGPTAAASGDYSAAIGNAASTTGLGDTALGASSKAAGGGTFATALGSWSQATAAGATAVGGHAEATAANATALGYNAQATTPNSVALGNNAVTGTADSPVSVVLKGTTYQFAGTNPVGVVSVGSAGAERQLTNVATGQLSAQSTDAVNGSQLYATNQALAGIKGSITDPVSYDDDTWKTMTLAGDGGTTISNVAPGALSPTSTDAINGSQLYQATTTINNTLTTAGWGAQSVSTDPAHHEMGGFNIAADGSVNNPAVLYTPNTIGTASPQIVLDPGQGDSAYFVNGDRAQGYLPKGTVISNVANGIQDTDAASVGQVKDIAQSLIGGGNGGFDMAVQQKPLLRSNGLLGASSGSGVNLANTSGDPYAMYNYYMLVRGATNASGSASPTDIARVSSSAAAGIAIGSNAETDGAGGVALGVQSRAIANDTVALGAGSIADQANTVSVGSDGATRYMVNADGTTTTVQSQVNARRIVNVGAGQGSTDAVNVSQLTGVTNALGGGASVNADGSIAAPAYAVAAGTYSNVSGALTALDGQISRLSSDAVTYDSTAHDKVSLSGVGATTQTLLTNVAAGDISTVSSTDAVNGGQLFATNQNVSNLSAAVTNFGGDVTNLYGKVADAVSYDSSAHASVTLGGTGAAVALHNVASGIGPGDAVNVSQLNSAGFQLDSKGAVQNKAVTYDAGSIASGSPTITLDPGTGNSAYFRNGDRSDPLPAGTVISNVASGILDTDAVNVGQVYDITRSQLPAGSGFLSPSALKSNGLLGASSGSGVNLANTSGDPYAMYNYYMLVRGATNASGSASPTDIARVSSSAAAGIAIGSNAETDGAGGVALGVQSRAIANDTVALGAGSIADQANTVSVGSDGATRYMVNADGTTTTVQSQVNARRIVNVGAGQGSTDAVNVSQLTGVTNALGGGASVNADGSIAAPAYAVAGGSFTDVGSALAAIDAKPGGAGDDPNAVHYDSSAQDSVTLGSKAQVKLKNVAAGDISNVSSTDAVNGGQLFATNQTVSNLAGAVTNFAGDVTNLYGKVADAVMYDSSAHTSVTFGGSGAAVTLRNVAAGAVSATSFDAVNGSQLYGLANSTATALGGKSKVNPDGSISAPSYDLGDSGTFSDVGSALVAIDSKVATGSVDGVKYDTSAHDKLTLGGSSATVRTLLTNVAAGDISNASSTDAVNGGQLFATNQTVSNLAGAVTNFEGDVTNLYGKVADAVMYDSSAHASVTFGGTGAAVTLRNVAAGAVGATSYDAVNGSQLYGLASSTAAALGGKSSVNQDGSITAPTYLVDGHSYYDVGTAFDAVVAYAGGGSVDAVMYDSSAHNKITLGGVNGTNGPVQLTNLANATQASDAVNLAQLEAMGARVDTSGNVTNAFVAYDDATKGSVTFGGSGTTNGVLLHNVGAGSQDLDAVNVAQLKAAGLNVDTSGNVLNAFVSYDDTSKSSITLGGVGSSTPVALHNVANGSEGNDAVNVAQLQAMGAIVDSSGNVTNAFVAYDDSSKGSITLGGVGSSTPVALHNVKAGSVSTSSTDAVNGTQLYNLASSTASSLGGGSTVTADGTISAPIYNIGGNTYNSVGGALTNIDGRVTNIENTVTTIAGSVANAVQYDSSAHDQITLGGSSTAAAVKLTNLQDADLTASSTDAVTGGQLYATNTQVSNLSQAIQNINVTGSEYLATNTSNGAASATGTNSIAAGGGAVASGASSTAIGDKASATGNNSVALGANSVADQDNTVSVGSQGSERRITNVANGVNATDAVNMGQLQSGMNSLQNGMNTVARNAYSGVAAATALTMIPDVDQGKTIAVGVGTANFQGYQATALGVSARITQNMKVKMGAGYSASGGATWGGGMSYQW